MLYPDPYHAEQSAEHPDLWQVLLYKTPCPALWMTEHEARLICAALNEAFVTGYRLGYDAGQNSAARQRWITGG